MKLISLNTWGGRIEVPLLEFFKNHQEVDIFCLQEIYHNAPAEEQGDEFKNDTLDSYSKIAALLPNHVGYFRPQIKDHYGIAMFINKDISIITEGEAIIHDVPDYSGGFQHPRNLQYIKCHHNGSELTIAHVHGLWTGGGKKDTPERLEQSHKIRAFLDAQSGSKILCGDFNLEPDTESITIIKSGLEDLIAKYGITSTRTSHYTKPVKFADYIFCTPDVVVNDFKVLPEEVSDHAALFLDFK